VSYPVLGILTIGVEAHISFKFGYAFLYEFSTVTNGCRLVFQPYLSPGFAVYGSVSLLVVKGGVFAAGSLINTKLHFGVDIWDNYKQGKIFLNVEVTPFSLQFGAFYQTYGC